VLDLTQDGGKDYFMTDTIHLGWRGWLAVDQKVNPFLSKKTKTKLNYQLNDEFYSTRWQQLNPNDLSSFK